ncbi:MAG: tRNA (adenosine(37)-N6)-threonylcarbamoyltransferase complex ATPase subunit type 1 TsaE [Candidatus Gastranaerophilales bacterium]|nr:tRNA (adenosine(37)-N6)-threonylcarbamoyltransferase complex ATPase subunit type 1 TsaE [Candidatus Gastranaerophilales bacterium]
MKVITKTLEDTKELAKVFAQTIPDNGLFITLTGDIGAGKTQFIRYVLEYLHVKDKITSPSFVILNEYKCSRFPIYHFDLYRLEEKGLKSIISELREYSRTQMLTFIEWAEFAHDEIPSNALKINVEYDENDIDTRIFEFKGVQKDFLDNFIQRIKDNEYFSNLFGIE